MQSPSFTLILIISNHDRHGCTKISYWLFVLLRVTLIDGDDVRGKKYKKSIIFVKEEKRNRKRIFL